MEHSLFHMASLTLTSIIFHYSSEIGRPPVDEVYRPCSSSGIIDVDPDQQKE